jgi:hypothetical protein
MGYAITWCAVREAAAEELLSRLGLSPTGRSEQEPESALSTAKLKSGWRLIWSNTYACPILSQALPARSSGHEVVLCMVEDHVMASSAELWSGGKRRWRISHEGENGPTGLDADGALPECFAAIRQEMEDKQAKEGGEAADVDYLFEIPLKVAEVIVGFKHDEDHDSVVEGDFVVLSKDGERRGFFSRLLGAISRARRS